MTLESHLNVRTHEVLRRYYQSSYIFNSILFNKHLLNIIFVEGAKDRNTKMYIVWKFLLKEG